MTNRILLLACFLSGAASLFYQVLWTRAYSLILGSTVQAASLIFAAFLTGLALGTLLFGSLSGRLKNPLFAYILLEVGIAVIAVATGLILLHNADTLGALIGGGATKYPLAFLLAVLMILPPTLLMGGTLPVVLTIAQRHDSRLTIVGRFYGWNTFGAAIGTLVCGFFAIRLLGISQSYYCAMALNLSAAALCALLLLNTRQPMVAGPGTSQQTGHAVKNTLSEGYLLLIAGASGALVLSLEVVWSRFAGFVLGNRTYAFTLLMFTVLTLLAAGSWLSAWLYRSSLTRSDTNPYAVFVNLLALSALAIVLSAAGGWWLVENQSRFEALLPNLQSSILLYRFLEAFVLLALPLLFLGALLPLAVAQSRHCAGNIGRTTARFYVVNAIGIVLGSLGTGFIGIELLGSFGMFKLLVIALLVLMLYTLIKGASVPRFATTVGVIALAAMVFLPNTFPLVLRSGETLVVENEDEYGVFRLTEMANGNLRVTNNRSELVYHLGSYSTDFVQQMQGHLGLHFNPEATEALVIGNGYGISAGVLALYDGIENVDAVEILPSMVDAADSFVPSNFSYHKNPKVHVEVDDGRHFLVRQDKQYDIITLNVSDPHLPGGATLFHSDFYEVVKQHLKPGGVMIQHVFGSEGATIANTLAASFPYLRFSQSYSNGYNVVASMEPLDEAAKRAMQLPLAALRQLQRSGRGRQLMIPPLQEYHELPASMHSDVIASDDFPAVEFSWNPGEKTLFINE